MMPADHAEAILAELAHLPPPAPDPRRTERTRQRCRTLLATRHRRRDAVSANVDAGRRRLLPVVAGAFGLLLAIYVTALVATSLSLRSLVSPPPLP